MRQWIRSHLTYANVMSTLAVFLVIGGGTALASYVITSNSQVGPGTISGHKPPTGKHANIIAGSVNGQDLSGGIKSSLRLHCPSDLHPVPDNAPVLCAETSTRPYATYATALKRCAVVGLRLPTDGELALVYELGSTAPMGPEWTSSHYYDSKVGYLYAASLSMDDARNLDPTFDIATIGGEYYRCVTTPSNN
jgi:hypothetical protein